MENLGGKSKAQRIIQQANNILKIPWLEIVNIILSLSERIKPLFQPTGLYEVLDYETTLELHDSHGRKASAFKRQKVQYLQNHIIAYQDQAWGDGEILIGYKCTPGIPVDQYQLGHKTILLISLREEKNKDDIDDFHIIWQMRGGFTKETESWGTSIFHKTRKVTVNIIFPQSRPPLKVFLIEEKSRKTYRLGQNSKKQLPDGRWQITWKRFKPKLNDEYLLEWKW